MAIIELSGKLNVGDKIGFERGGEELFEQVVESIQIEHEDKKSAGKGDDIGLKIKEGYIFALEPMIVADNYRVRVEADDWTVTTIDGGNSVHFEHTVAVTGSGPRILSHL